MEPDPTVPPTKSFLESKRFWFNVLALAGGVAVLFGYSDHVPDEWVPIAVTAISSALNLIWTLRAKQLVGLP